MNETQIMDATTMRITSQSNAKLAAMQKAKLSGGNNTAKIDDVAQEFEAQFVSQMLQNMFDTVPVNEEFGGGEGEEMFRSLVIDEYGKLISRAGGVGVADQVKREMIRTQEVG
jgi:Rod binding domain-containing protein